MHIFAQFERSRLKELKSYHNLDTPIEQEYEDNTCLASVLCDVPIAIVSFLDEDREWFKSCRGLSKSQGARDFSFCTYAIKLPESPLIITDAREDKRFEANVLVTDFPT